MRLQPHPGPRGLWTLIGESYYGLKLSLIGSLVLLVATIGEGVTLLGRRLFW